MKSYHSPAFRRNVWTKVIMSLCVALLIVVGSCSRNEPGSAWLFNPSRTELYSREELWNGYDSDPAKNRSFDWQIFEYFTGSVKYNPTRKELLAQRSHDAGMDYAINQFLELDSSASQVADGSW